jgi:hypothetical protein
LIALAKLWILCGEFSYDIGVERNVLMTKCAVYSVRVGEDRGDEDTIDLGRHVAMYSRPMWVERQIDFHGSIKKFLDKEDV